MQNLRIAGVIDLPECLPTFCFQIVRFGIFYLNNDSGVRIIDLNHDITEAVSGFPVRADHPSTLETENSQKKSMIEVFFQMFLYKGVPYTDGFFIYSRKRCSTSSDRPSYSASQNLLTVPHLF